MPVPHPLPANSTKHLPVLNHPLPRDEGVILPLRQISSEGGSSTGTTGTTLWLGAQVLAAYLSDTLPATAVAPAGRHKRCLDLGSGVGYLPLCLATWGWDVISTDIEPVVSTVLTPNIEAGLDIVRRTAGQRGQAQSTVGSVNVHRLDWMDYLESSSTSIPPPDPLQGDYIDLILTTDTLYTPSLTLPLWFTITHLSETSRSRHPREKAPELVLALENRDSVMIAQALDVGRKLGWSLKRLPDTRVQKAVEKAGWGWGRAEWEGVEVWKGRLA